MRVSFAFLTAFAAFSASAAGLTLGKPFSDGAILQRGTPIPVWGTAIPGEKVKVEFAGQVKTAVAAPNGAWRVTLDPLEASRKGRTLTVTASNRTIPQSNNQTVLHDVLVGEVWLCSGQSNMEMALVDPNLPRYRDGIGAMVAQMTRKPLVRYLKAPGAEGWQAFTPEFLSSGRRSALAVHYALELYLHLEIPIGVVVAAVGGCNIDSFLPDLKPASNLDRHLLDGLYPYALRGALWYQGETNIYLGEVEEYGVKLRSLSTRWRSRFESPKLGFYYVQLAPFIRGNKVTHKEKDGTTRVVEYDNLFPRFLSVQAAFEKEDPNAAMVVINDLGCVGDIHPNEKWLVAKRLALRALKREYGFADIEDASPELRTATAEGGRAKLVFDHAESMYVYHRAKSFAADAPFELAGEDGVFKPAKIMNYLPFKSMNNGTITNNVIELSSAGVSAPKKVRYAWKSPWTGVVYNQVNLPLATFAADLEETRP